MGSATRRLARHLRRARLSKAEFDNKRIVIRLKQSDDIWFSAAVWVIASKRKGEPIAVDLSALRPGKQAAFWEAAEALKDLDPNLTAGDQQNAVRSVEERVRTSGQKGASAQLNLRL